MFLLLSHACLIDVTLNVKDANRDVFSLHGFRLNRSALLLRAVAAVV